MNGLLFIAALLALSFGVALLLGQMTGRGVPPEDITEEIS